MDSSKFASADSLQQRYRATLVLSGLLIFSAIAYFSWTTFSNQKAALYLDIAAQGEHLQRSLNERIDITQTHVFSMRRTIERNLTQPVLADITLARTLRGISRTAPADAPMDDLPDSLRLETGSLLIDSQASIDPRIFERDLSAVTALLPQTVALHQRQKLFQWSYYYDAKERWFAIYPKLSKGDLLASTQTKDLPSGLKVLFDADGTKPVSASGPLKNPRREPVWTRPYNDAGGKGMMVTLLAPVYLHDQHIGTVGTDVTLTMLGSVLADWPVKLARTMVVDRGGFLLADSGGALVNAKGLVLASDVVPSDLLSPAGEEVSPGATSHSADAVWMRFPLPDTPWTLLLEVPNSASNEYLRNVLRPYVVMTLLLVAALLALAWIQNRRFTQPALLLAGYVDQADADPDITIPEVPSIWRHWFERISLNARARRELLDKTREHAEQLERKVALRTQDLSAANAALEKSIEELKATQSRLVRSEKLAALGSMVAGVAHEMKTPLGNALLTISTLRGSHNQLLAQLQEGVRRSQLDKFLEEVSTACELSERNVAAASKLVQRFKEVAVDESREDVREVVLRDLTDMVTATLASTSDKTPFLVVNKVPADVVITSYPVALGQVLSNLIANALIHAFDGRTHGDVVIGAIAKGDRLLITVSDNGCGIDEASLPRIFDPFFTTKMGRGGTGLGLHIVLTTVENVLRGTIEVSSSNEGTKFSLELPVNVTASNEDQFR